MMVPVLQSNLCLCSAKVSHSGTLPCLCCPQGESVGQGASWVGI